MSPNPLKSLLFAFAAIAIILVLTALQTVSFWVFDVAVLLAVVLVATLAFRSFSNLPPKPMLESTAAGLFAFCPAYLALVTIPDQAISTLFVATGTATSLTIGLVGGSAWYYWARRDARQDPGRCERCGYLLRGLPEPRCPECGTPFDRRKQADADA
jgi:uncharacterized paraquat-inducible protein A